MTQELLAVVLLSAVVVRGQSCNDTGCIDSPADQLFEIRTVFQLFTRESRTTPQKLRVDQIANVVSVWTNFKIRRTQVLVHGFLDQPEVTLYFVDMKEELLKHGDYNVILVDYSDAFRLIFRPPWVYTRRVGRQISDLINRLISLTGITAGDFHIIGHSLGGHVAGEAAEGVKDMRRVTALDPGGGPFYELASTDDRTDDTDAKLVDVIHTDTNTYIIYGNGIKKAIGHLDYYPNGGHNQPGCASIRNAFLNFIQYPLVQAVGDTFICSHVRVLRYFTESINSPCKFLAVPCDSEEDFKNNKCTSCTDVGCRQMGFHADKNPPPPGQHVKYFLTTAGSPPFCIK